MATDPKYGNAAVNAEADALSVLLDNGFFRIYGGGAGKPATCDTAVTDQTLLAECRYNADAAPVAVAGLLTFNALTSDASANATGTAAWYRALKSDGTTPIMDGTVGTAAADAIINNVAIQVGTEVEVTSHTLQLSKG